MNHRPERVAKLIQEELAAMFARELEFPGALVTVSDVEVSKKLDAACVKIGVVPPYKAAAVQEAVNKARAELQFSLTRKLNIKPMPHVRFEIDRGLENAAAVEKKLLESAEG